LTKIDWLVDLKKKLPIFLDELSENDYRFFRYSYSGDLYGCNQKWGLANLVFATKIFYLIGLIERINPEKKRNILNGINRFKNLYGFYYDPLITKKTKRNLVKNLIPYIRGKDKQIEQIRRAETRQSFAAINLLNHKPISPFTRIPTTKTGVDDYLRSLSWDKPWDAGSHFSHLLFFLKMNEFFFPGSCDNDGLIKFAINWIFKIQSKDDGCWYWGGEVSLTQKINGAMKVLTGFHAAGIYDISYAKQLINTALSGINDKEACSNFNIVYVLYGASLVVPNYKKDEIQKFLLNRISLYREFYHPDLGGFSFHKQKANEFFFNKRITFGKNEPDIHGTLMFTWGLSIINAMIDLDLDFRIPLN